MWVGFPKKKVAEKKLIDEILFADAEMPEFLRKVLEIYLDCLNQNERGILLSWILANGEARSMKGPEIVRLLIERGGITAKKLAQLIASHGFRLDGEYQRVLEVFKGQAQKIDKIEAMRWIAERLPKDKYEQIASLDRELGSGSLKIAYLATLKDGRKVVIMLTRDLVIEKTYREFQVIRAVIERMMQDSELRIETLPALEREVERIVREEMKFEQEIELMKRHKEAALERPFLVRHFGNQVSVNIPQPLEGWSSENIIVEEYVEAKGWRSLPGVSQLGWSKEKLAKAAIAETLNQILSYMDKGRSRYPRVLLDIDPHEENQLAETTRLGRRRMVNIDLGQSVEVEPQSVRNVVQGLIALELGETERGAQFLESIIELKNSQESAIFREELHRQLAKGHDPVETFTKTIEEIELKGIGLKSEYLFLQKLFATMVGLKRHVRDPDYLMRQTYKIASLRAVSQPKEIVREYEKLQQAMGPGFSCASLVHSYLSRLFK
jgi:predicted unusual protein kinase regulating ubiquinone biosynthesis (AarF/ABC1/UbiB family)